MTRYDRFILKVLAGLVHESPIYIFDAQDIVDVTGEDYDKIEASIERLVTEGYIVKHDDPLSTAFNYGLTDKGLAVKFRGPRKPEDIRTLLACAEEIERLHHLLTPQYEGKVGEPNIKLAQRARDVVKRLTV